MLWLTGHWEWHALCCYVVVPLEGEPTLVYSMGGTHAEAVRRITAAALSDVRGSRGGRYADVMVERIRELKLERGRIGLLEIDPRHKDYLPVNQYNVLREGLPEAELVFTAAGCTNCCRSTAARSSTASAGRKAVRGRHERDGRRARGPASPSISCARRPAPRSSKAAATSTSSSSARPRWTNPALVFGNPRPSGRVLQAGRHHQHGACRRLSRLHARRSARRSASASRPTWCEAILGRDHAARLSRRWRRRSSRATRSRRSARRENSSASKGVQSRPIHAHGIDLITDGPHVFCEHVDAEPFEQVFKPGMVFMAEPNPITRRRPVRHLPRPHLHRHRDRQRVRRRVSLGAGGGRLTRLTRNTRQPDQREADHPEHDERSRDRGRRRAGRPWRPCGYRRRGRAPPSRWW